MSNVIAPGITIEEYTPERAFEVFEKRTKDWILAKLLPLTEQQDTGIVVLIIAAAVVEPMGRILSEGGNGEVSQIAALNFILEDSFVDLKFEKDMRQRVCKEISSRLRDGLFHEGFIKLGLNITELTSVIAYDGKTVFLDPNRFAVALSVAFGRLCEKAKAERSFHDRFLAYWTKTNENNHKKLNAAQPIPFVHFENTFIGTSATPGVTLAVGTGCDFTFMDDENNAPIFRRRR